MITLHETVAAVAAGSLVPAPVQVVAGSLTLDAEWAPYARADVTVVATPEMIALDPRVDHATLHLTLSEVSGHPGQVHQVSADYLGDTLAHMAWPGKTLNTFSTVYADQFVAGTPWRSSLRHARLTITARTHHRERGEVTLTAFSREVEAQGDLAVPGLAPLVYTAATLPTLAHAVLGSPVAGSSPLSLTGADLTREPGTSAWHFLAPFVDEAGQRLWCDELGNWHLGPPTPVGVVRSDIELVRAADTIDLRGGDYADHVILTHRHTDAGGASTEATSAASVGNRRGLAITRHTRNTGQRIAATHILARALTRGRRLQATAVSRYDLSPGDVLPGEGVLTAVTWDLATHEMTLTTRDD